jgi:Leucine-rich repeat (LRR) protein
MSKKKTIQILLFLFLLVGYNTSYSQEEYLSAEEIESHEAQIDQLINFLEYSFNTIGNPEIPVKEKEIIVNESYLKIFRDEQVQIEDDLDENRNMVTNKDVQAYLKDINFFFKEVEFRFDVEEITHDINEKGEIYFKVSMNRNLKGMTIGGDSVNNNLPRYIEINLNDKAQDLKIVSIYTTKLSEAEDMANWWFQLPPAWKEYFVKDIHHPDTLQWARYDSVFLEVNDSIRIRLFDTIPEATRSYFQRIRQLWSLTEIDISNNKDITSLEPLKKLRRLKTLDISNTSINDLTPIRNLAKLKKFDCSYTEVNSVEAIHYSLNLKELNLQSTGVRDLLPVRNFVRLEHLDCSNTGITDLEPLSGTHTLKELICHNSAVDFVSPLKELTALEKLDLSDTRITTIEPLQDLENLKYLNVSNTLVDDLQPLSKLSNLQYIYLDYTPVENLTPLLSLSNLERIYCDHSYVNQAIAASYQKERPEVLVIYDTGELGNWWNSLNDVWKNVMISLVEIDSVPTREQLHKMLQIHEIDISRNEEIKNIDALLKLYNLHKLDVSNTNITSIEPLVQNIHLQNLDISGSKVDNLGPLMDLSSLTWLDLSNTAVEDVIALQNMTDLEYLNIDQTLVSDISPLTGLEKLGFIYADHSGVLVENVTIFKETNSNCQVIFQTDHLQNWWNDLSEEWIAIIKSNANLTTTPSKEELQELVYMKEIQFHDKSGISSLKPLEMFTELEKIESSNTSITGVSPLRDLEKLHTIRISDSPLKSIEPLLGLHLESLTISNTQVEDISSLEKVTTLKKLNISGTPVKSLKFCSSLTNLEELEFHNTKVNNLKPLLELTNLKAIKCFRTGLSQNKVAKFQKARQDIEIIYY